jgi:osmotically inducible protein OsmC
MSIRVTRTAHASWQGTVSDGGGRIALGSGAYEGPFTLRARVEDVERATNPEELIGAAAAGCFTMSLANLLSEGGHPPTDLRTTARVRLEQLEAGFSLTRIELSTVGDVPGIDAAQFAAAAEQAKATCPVSRALASTEITHEASLAGQLSAAGG